MSWNLTTSTATAMIGFRERSEQRRSIRDRRSAFGAKAAIFFLWVILVFALISLVLSIQNESRSRSSSSSHSIRPQRREGVFISRALFHAPPSSLSTHRAQVVGTNGGITDTGTLYGDDKRIIHTGPNPLHN